MTRGHGSSRWGFRARLTAMIAVVFVSGGAVLLGVQYLLVQRLFTDAIVTMSTVCFGGDTGGAVADSTDSSQQAPTDCESIAHVQGEPGTGTISSDIDGNSVFVEHGTRISEEVLSGLLGWSIVTLIAFAGIATFASYWLSHRSFSRIAHITDTTRTITRSDLHQRLDLGGPDDEIKELGDTIDTMLDRLHDSFTRQERFIANASHELRTPLTTTRTALEIPLQHGLVPDELQPSIQRALAANERSEALISALLALARSTPRPASEAVPLPAVDLSEVLADSIARHADDARARSITIEEAPSDPLLVGVDGVLLQLAVDNLVDNAIRHNVHRGSVWLSAGSTTHDVFVEVRNTGSIVTDAEAAALKEPFNRGTQTRLSNASQGLGLGLTVVETVVEASNGALSIVAQPGGGLTCRLQLPCRTSAKEPVEA